MGGRRGDAVHSALDVGEVRTERAFEGTAIALGHREHPLGTLHEPERRVGVVIAVEVEVFLRVLKNEPVGHAEGGAGIASRHAPVDIPHAGEVEEHEVGRDRVESRAPACAPLTSKDMDDIKTAAALKADFLAVSFPKSGADMYMARELMRAAGGNAMLIAKIERSEAVTNEALRDIMKACDGIMVARGDLAVEVGDAAVPALQKRMIRMAREMNKLTITATQMMESMVSSPIPTRAEVSDVANAVLDGTDAVMLSAESASGQYPVETVEAMARICVEAEKSADVKLDREFLDRVFTRVDQSIAMAALFTAHHLKVKCIASLTQSGSTALWMSRLNSGVPIYALTPEKGTLTKTALMRDVRPFTLAYEGHDREKLMKAAEQVLLDNGVAAIGDIVVITMGEPIGQSGGTNTMKIVTLGEHRGA